MERNFEGSGAGEKKRIRVLCVEDNSLDRGLIRHALEKEADNFKMIEAVDREMFEKLLNEGEFDMVLTDFNILGFEGIEVLRGVKERHPDIPVIIVTGTGSEEIAVQALKEGADDYIIKDPRHIAQLPGTILRVMDAKETRNRLRKREANVRAISENVADGVVVVDRQGYVVFSNPAAGSLFGSSPEELVGTVFEYPVGDSRFFEIDLPRRAGGPGTAEMRISETDWDGENCSIIAMRDITDRKRSEQLLKESEERNRKILRSAMDGIWIEDIQGHLLDVNDAYCRMSGYSEQELLGMPISDLEAAESTADVEEHIKNIKARGEDRFETLQHRKDGSIYDVEVSTVYIPGEPGQIVAFLRDITDRKRAEEELLRTAESLNIALTGTIRAMSRIVDLRDPYTAGHQKRMADLAGAIAEEMGMDEERADFIRLAGSIHDIGKISVPAEILSKPAKLSETEFNLVRVHPQTGYDMLKDVDFPWPIADVILQHHERFDGSGYPNGLKGDEMLPEARILAVADVVESMASHRPYRATLGLDSALEEIEKNRGVLYTPAVVDACIEIFRQKGYQLPDI